MEFQKNDIVTVTIDDMGNEGEGIGKVDGFTLFVKDAVPGDKVEARIVKNKKNYAYARLEKVVVPSPFRVEPGCAFHRQCGGCQLQALSYERQLAFKQEKIRNSLIRIGGFAPEYVDKRMEPIVGMEEPFRYRNKAQYPVGADKDGNPVAGFYAGRTHSIVANTSCLLGAEENKFILNCILKYMYDNNVSAYDETAGTGLVRHVLIRKGFTSGEIMVCLVINYRGERFRSGKLQEEMALKEELKQGKRWKEKVQKGKARQENSQEGRICADIKQGTVFAEGRICVESSQGTAFSEGRACADSNQETAFSEGRICADIKRGTVFAEGRICAERNQGTVFWNGGKDRKGTDGNQDKNGAVEFLPNQEALISELMKIKGMTSVSVSINTRQTNVIMGEEIHTIWGRDTISDTIHMRDMRQADFPFTGRELTFQISPLSFYQVNPAQTEKLYSLALEYAGLTGQETVWDLYCGIGTISLFLAGSAKKVYGVEIIPPAVEDAKENAERNGIGNAEFIVGKAEEVLQETLCPPDVVVVDPPRKGCDRACLEAVLRVQPERIVYVSCDPATLARDLRMLCDGGYEVERVRGVDQFGMTVHVETVCLLSKLHSNQHIEVELRIDELDLTAAESKATYEEIKEYVLKEYGLKISNLYIAQVKRKCRIVERGNYNLPKSESSRQPKCPPEKEMAIIEALKHFGMIEK